MHRKGLKNFPKLKFNKTPKIDRKEKSGYHIKQQSAFKESAMVRIKFTGKTPKGELAFYLENGVPVKAVARCNDGKKESTQNLTGGLGALLRSATLTWVSNLKPSKGGKGW